MRTRTVSQTVVKMALLRPLDKLPTLDVATILLLGAKETLLEQLGMTIIKECEGTDRVQVHVASCLPLPTDRECFRPRIDLIVFVLSLHSKHSLRTVQMSLPHVDAHFFLGKVCFLASGGGILPSFNGPAPYSNSEDLCGLCARPVSPEPAVYDETVPGTDHSRDMTKLTPRDISRLTSAGQPVTSLMPCCRKGGAA
ncbi:centromere protein M isoform X1 [Petaurus breviceps papuanus]|uniref:centromere protein M isoform X1 n=1 Tax=Petaurus breviceps papuanus TaxID=3040969 RepID=UPI0036DEC452